MLTAQKRPMLWTGANRESRDGARMSTVLRAEPTVPILSLGIWAKTAACRRGLRMPIIRRTDETGHENYDIGLTKDTSY